MFLRQSSLIFNSPGKNYSLFTASDQEFQETKLPASYRLRRVLTSQHNLKCETTHIASQRVRDFGVCQPASGGVRFEPASEVSIHNFSKVLQTSIVINTKTINGEKK